MAEALTSADFQHSSWIHAAVVEVFGIFASDRDTAVQTCDALTPGATQPVQDGAAILRDMLAEISPVLYLQQDR